MNLRNQVCAFDQGAILKELGVDQGIGTFYYLENFGIVPRLVYDGYRAYKDNGSLLNALNGQSTNQYYFLPTVAELSIMLPSETYAHRNGSEDSEFANWEWVYEGGEKAWGMFETMAEAMADCLIMLIQNKIINIEDVNKRLNN